MVTPSLSIHYIIQLRLTYTGFLCDVMIHCVGEKAQQKAPKQIQGAIAAARSLTQRILDNLGGTTTAPAKASAAARAQRQGWQTGQNRPFRRAGRRAFFFKKIEKGGWRVPRGSGRVFAVWTVQPTSAPGHRGWPQLAAFWRVSGHRGGATPAGSIGAPGRARQTKITRSAIGMGLG